MLLKFVCMFVHFPGQSRTYGDIDRIEKKGGWAGWEGWTGKGGGGWGWAWYGQCHLISERRRMSVQSIHFFL